METGLASELRLSTEFKSFRKGGHAFVIDVNKVQFIVSSVLGVWLPDYKNANLRASGFALVGLQPRTKSMFELTRLHQVFVLKFRPHRI